MMETRKEFKPFEFDRHDTYDWYLEPRPARRTSTRSTSTASIPTWNDFVAHSELRRLLEATGESRRTSTRVTRADAQRRRLVGPGGLLRAAHDLRDAGEARHEADRTSSSSARGTTAAGAAAGRAARARSTSAARRGEYSPGRSRRPASPTGSRTRASSTCAEATMFETGTNRWRVVRPLAADRASADRRLYFQAGRQAVVRRRRRRRRASSSTRTSPTRRTRCRTARGPIQPTFTGGFDAGPRWLVEDQRFVEGRPDVLTLGDRAARPRTSSSPARSRRTCSPRRRAPTATGS